MENQGFDVQSEALRRYAQALGDFGTARQIEEIRRRTQGYKLSGSVFGMLPESDALRDDYNAQLDRSGEDLRDGAELLRNIAKNLKESADDYDATEDGAAHGFGGGH
ncbi:hypothetical protein [Streptomyces sp. 8N706]|uniref:hypothetical protein n=1 Tax=Streptomyces sp. 8N706 TaxID=3457416 RepID=UPI003FCEFD4D